MIFKLFGVSTPKRLPSACGLLFSRQNFYHLERAWFRAKTSVIRVKLFALRSKSSVIRGKLLAVSRQNVCCPPSWFVTNVVDCFQTNNLFDWMPTNVSLPLLFWPPWTGTPSVRMCMETAGLFSPLTPWRRQTPCALELVSWSKVNSSKSQVWISQKSKFTDNLFNWKWNERNHAEAKVWENNLFCFPWISVFL